MALSLSLAVTPRRFVLRTGFNSTRWFHLCGLSTYYRKGGALLEFLVGLCWVSKSIGSVWNLAWIPHPYPIPKTPKELDGRKFLGWLQSFMRQKQRRRQVGALGLLVIVVILLSVGEGSGKGSSGSNLDNF